MGFKIRLWIIAVATLILLLYAFIHPPEVKFGQPPIVVLRAVLREYPGFQVESVQPETWNGRRAWLVTGTDKQGSGLSIDVSNEGRIIMHSVTFWTAPQGPH